MIQDATMAETTSAHVAAQDAVAEFSGATKRFGEVLAADRINLRIRRGEFLSFLGPSGCGKTTALRMLAGFETPTEGSVLIDGHDVSAVPAHKRPVNMVFQHYALFPHMTVAQNVGYGLRQRRPRLSRSDIAQKVDKALATVRLEAFGERRIWELSGGQQQRVALARAIINEPQILLLDEPMAALDAKLRGEMQRELLELQRSLNITFVLVTHDQEEALSMSDRICIMGKGRIAQVGSPQELYDRPSNRYVADFVGKANIVAGQIAGRQGGMAQVVLGNGTKVIVHDLPADNRQHAEIAIRPEALSIAPQEAPLPEGTVALASRVTHRTFLGDRTEYLLVADGIGPLQVNAPRQAARALGEHDVGAQVHILWPVGTGLVLAADT
ncbi:ABC transporter ATP-binding protein [Puniceibacterium sp. IMCC21224]|uniref:ABC transporter ATP-binding protein n=1 Tax=Puniceibacterium sp. IMCC21224 TaxID=1618204 RepID=UPI00065D63F6|nr:ABC transporter ATP-binding protein [Puniceibacterium sp. IMCC21224]KMK64770.1 spermidine/putrescine ABC transporter ATP-binding subunit [Puniceibacterium sp. IMCC21224]